MADSLTAYVRPRRFYTSCWFSAICSRALRSKQLSEPGACPVFVEARVAAQRNRSLVQFTAISKYMSSMKHKHARCMHDG